MNFRVGRRVRARVPGCPKEMYNGTIVVLDCHDVGVSFDSPEVTRRWDMNDPGLRGFLWFRHGSREFPTSDIVPLVLKTSLTEE